MSEPQKDWNFGWYITVAIITFVVGIIALVATNELPTEMFRVRWANPSSSLPPSPPINNPTLPSSAIRETSPVTQESPDGCGEQLSSKLGRYEGTSVITSLPHEPSGKIIIDISRETAASCRLIARVEELAPLNGEGTLKGQFDPNIGQEVVLIGSLSSRERTKVWNVEMTIQFTDKNSIKGRAPWRPESGPDPETYLEEFTATKSF